MKNRIYLERADDRDAVTMSLARNGYSVRQGKEKVGNKWAHFAEYWRDGA